MDAKIGEEQPPKSTDLAAWRLAVADGRCFQFPLEAIVAAIQDLGPNADKAVRNALAKHLSVKVVTLLRRNTGRNHPNKGEDIIYRVHFQIFEAVARPKSADGKALRVACVARILFRLKDAIAKEARDRRVPDETQTGKSKKKKEAPKLDNEDRAAVNVVATEMEPDVAEEIEHSGGEEAPSFRFKHDPSLMDGVLELDEQIDVNCVLEENISDDRKRLAFRLFMDDVPYKSKKSNSIEKALGVDEKTAREWIHEVREHLKGKVGGKS